MARTKQNQRVDTPRSAGPTTSTTGGRTPPSRLSTILLTISALSALWAVAMLTPSGRAAYVYAFFYAEFYAGVIVLVGLSITVMLGLLATDRIVMMARHRVLVQSAHRTTGFIAVVALVLHVFTKVSMGKVSMVDVFVPFMAANQALYVGMGTLASYLLMSVFWTGIVRARFAGTGRPWVWRALHSLAYASWPVALLHGLRTGRPAATWVTTSYVLCILLVVIAMLVRLSVALNRRQRAWANTTSTGSIKPVGKPAGKATSAVEVAKSAAKLSRRREAPQVDVVVEPAPPRRSRDRAAPATAVIDSWTRDEESGRRSRRAARADEVADTAEVRRRDDRRPVDDYRDEDYRRRDDRRDTGYRDVDYRDDHRDTGYRDDRRETDYRDTDHRDTGYRQTDYRETGDRDAGYRDVDDYRPAPRRSRRAAEEPAAYGAADDRDVDYRPAEAATRYSSEYATGTRSRRAVDERSAPAPRPAGRHSRDDGYRPAEPIDDYRVDDYRVDDYRAGSDDLPPDDTPTLIDMASRRARRAAGEGARATGRSARRRRGYEDNSDEMYWRQLRGEAQ